jgi:antitoxin component YwqK of YwqJK toxin-antitoxin module
MPSAAKVMSLVALLFLAACGGSTRSYLGTAPVLSTRGPDGTVSETTDLNGDGKPDIWTSFREVEIRKDVKQKVLISRSTDLNGDGRVDLVTAFDDKGDVSREDVDLDFDGRADEVRYFKKGKLERVDMSTQFDGKFDVRKFYEDGALVVKQVDTVRNGSFDEFQYFAGGKLARVGWDRDGDGKPEVFEENPALGE